MRRECIFHSCRVREDDLERSTRRFESAVQFPETLVSKLLDRGARGKGAERAAMQREAKAKGASELSVPGSVLVVEKVPLLGSGKTDYVAATAMAREIASAPEQDVA